MDKQTESRKAFEECYLNAPNFTDNESWAWTFWQKSRDSLVVELPDEDDYVMDEALDCLRDCKQSLRSIGIRIKGEGV
ncbi:TPA: hypothetical protein ACIAIE_005442 [Serratia fonticola]